MISGFIPVPAIRSITANASLYCPACSRGQERIGGEEWGERAEEKVVSRGERVEKGESTKGGIGVGRGEQGGEESKGKREIEAIRRIPWL